jgi:DNA-binding transcriptional LysR family regulator
VPQGRTPFEQIALLLQGGGALVFTRPWPRPICTSTGLPESRSVLSIRQSSPVMRRSVASMRCASFGARSLLRHSVSPISGRSSTTTRTLAERASKIYVDAEQAEDFARETSSRPRGLVKMAAPLSFGARWVAPLLPAFFRQYPDIAIDLHLTDAHTDLIGDGFDAALRIAVMEDSSLVARLIAPVSRFLVASPAYIAQHGRPQHPSDLGAHRCLSYANRAKRDVWRFTHLKTGEQCLITPTGPLRGTSVEALLPTVLEGLAITALPEFIATQYFPAKALEPILADWLLPAGGLYFVTPTARARPAKVSALADFLIAKLMNAPWRAEAVIGWKPQSRRKKQS